MRAGTGLRNKRVVSGRQRKKKAAAPDSGNSITLRKVSKKGYCSPPSPLHGEEPLTLVILQQKIYKPNQWLTEAVLVTRRDETR